MIRLSSVLTIVAVVGLLSFSAAAQSRPDFSGRWTSAPEATATPTPTPGGPSSGDMGSGWGTTINISQDANRLKIDYDFFARGDLQPPLSFVYSLDGTETTNSVMMGRGVQKQVSKISWDGAKLIINTTHNFEKSSNGQPSQSEVKRILWLESPTSLVVETTRDGGAASTTRTVYRKLAQP